MKNIIFITDDWGYTKGGINTINMDLCKALAALNSQDYKIFCIAIFIEKLAIKNAKDINVELISLFNSQPTRSYYEETDISTITEKLLESSSFTNAPSWIIGHDVITGKIALDLNDHLLKKRILEQSYLVIIHHMDYEDYEVNKETYAGKKIIDQRNLLKRADILFGVGPRLQKSACDIKQDENCPQLIPGIDVDKELISNYKKADPFKVIVCGRIGTKDDIIKNAQLAVKSWASSVNGDDRLVSSRINLVGCSESQREDLIRISSQYAGRRVTVNPFAFGEREQLLINMADHRLCIMPSLKEGFGLTGWEAISLGVPVILSKESGLYEWLDAASYSGYITSVDIHGGIENEDLDISHIRHAILEIYNNYTKYKEKALTLRERLLQDEITWENSARNFIANLEKYAGIVKKEYSNVSTIASLKVPVSQSTLEKPLVAHFTSDIFTDRNNIINKLFISISEGRQIINLYGKKGIGKSSVLRFMSDGINGIFSAGNQDKTTYFTPFNKLIESLDVHYIELSSQASVKKTLYNVYPILKEDPNNIFVSYTKLSEKKSFSKKHLLILDNANDGHNEEIFELHHAFVNSKNDNFCLLISSVKELPFTYLSPSLQNSVDIAPFKEKEIKEYAKNNNIAPNDNLVINIGKVSGGLPIYVKLLLKKIVNNRGVKSYRDMEKYLDDLLMDIEKQYTECYVLVIYISLLSIACDEGKGVSVSRLLNILHLQQIFKYLDILENYYSLIDHNKGDRCVKMHDVIRDICTKLILERNSNTIRTVLETFDKNDKKSRSYYLLLLEFNYLTTEEENAEIETAINEAIKKDNYIYLLSLGELFERIHSPENYNSISNKLYLHIIWGYIEGYIGVGNYPAARKIVDSCKISARDLTSDIHLNLSLSIAKLYHLQNEYQEAISTYNIIFSETNQKQITQKYKSLCLWGIAHSYRHEGKNLALAFKYYQDAIEAAKEENSISNLLKSELEQVAILDCWGRYEDADLLISNIQDNLKRLPEDAYWGCRISIKKAEARHLRIAGKKNKNAALTLLNEVLVEYKKIKKRLQYNTLFELGEYYRDIEKYQEAFDKYQEALVFAIKNRDKNLYTMGMLGVLLCELGAGEIFRKKDCVDKDVKSHEELLIEVITECEEYNLYTNRLLSYFLLEYISDGKVDTSIVDSFRELGYVQYVDVCNNISTSSLKRINLTLM